MANLELQSSPPTQRLMQEVYGLYWKQAKAHGPEQARTSLNRRVKSSLLALQPADWVLDLGSGRQALEQSWVRNWGENVKCNIATLDIAEIPQYRLLRKRSPNIHHVRGDGANLPFGDGTFSMAVSSMGLELMPPRAIDELARVLKPNGKAFLNILHPSVSGWKYEQLKSEQCITSKDKMAAAFWEHYAIKTAFLTDNVADTAVLFENVNLLVQRLETKRLTVASGEIAWIEADLVKK